MKSIAEVAENYNFKQQLFIDISTLKEYSFGTWQDIIDKGGLRNLIGHELGFIYNQDLLLHYEPREESNKELRRLKIKAHEYINKKALT